MKAPHDVDPAPLRCGVFRDVGLATSMTGLRQLLYPPPPGGENGIGENREDVVSHTKNEIPRQDARPE